MLNFSLQKEFSIATEKLQADKLQGRTLGQQSEENPTQLQSAKRRHEVYQQKWRIAL